MFLGFGYVWYVFDFTLFLTLGRFAKKKLRIKKKTCALFYDLFLTYFTKTFPSFRSCFSLGEQRSFSFPIIIIEHKTKQLYINL